MVLIDDPIAKPPPPNPFEPYTDHSDPLPPPSYTPEAGPSSSILPLNDDSLLPPTSEDHGAIELASSSTPLLPHGVEMGEAPPQFEVYRPSRTKVLMSGNVVSHDEHLNEDGEALYRFLLSESAVRPTMEIRIQGTHTSTTYVESVRRDAHGREQVSRTPRHDTVTDFSFRIDLSKLLNPPPEFYTSPDEEPAYRGEMYRETFVGGKKRAAPFSGLYERMAWRAERKRREQEPWCWKNVRSKGSRTVREWADEFCASPKVLKEFEYKKEVWGWDLHELERLIQRTAQNAFYHGMVQVTFPQSGTRIFVRRNTQFARILSNTAVKVVLWLLFIYPFILLYKYYWPTGGGKWAVAGEGWTYTVHSPAGLRQLSMQQWFQVWERRIRNAIEERVQSDEMLQTVEDYRFPDGVVATF